MYDRDASCTEAAPAPMTLLRTPTPAIALAILYQIRFKRLGARFPCIREHAPPEAWAEIPEPLCRNTVVRLFSDSHCAFGISY